MNFTGCCDDLNIPINGILSLFCGLLFSLLVIFMYKFIFGGLTTDFSYCTSENCVRCGKTKKIHKLARDVFEKISESGKHSFDRLGLAIENQEKLGSQLTKEKSLQQPEVFYIPDLSTRWWFDVNANMNDIYQKDIKLLEDNFDIIKDEFWQLYTLEVGAWTRNLVPYGEWSIFSLLNQGEFIENNCAHCPKTTKILHSMEKLMSGCLFGNALFSVVSSNTIIPGHFGATNARLRCHLGLIIPKGCELFIADERKEWQKGKCILFDDSFSHSVISTGNNNKDMRAVFIVDLWHPSLSPSECSVIRMCYSSGTLNASSSLLKDH